jgi:non-heme chloroperoxidase
MEFLTTTDKTKIFYRDIGEGKPVILIHGWPVNADMWEYQTSALLRKGFRVISYDRRGFGRSSHPARGFDYNQLADDLNALINHLEIQKVSLIGFSMGGGEIARYLTRHGSEKISRVALVSSVVPFMLKTDSNPDGVPEEKFQEIVDGLAQDRPHFLANFAQSFYGNHLLKSAVSNEILTWTSFMAFAASPLATQESVWSFGKTDFRPDLKSFTIPTLIIHGTADVTVPMKTAGAAAAKGIPNAIFKPYEGAPHGLFVTHKEQLTQDLLEFLGATASDRPSVMSQTIPPKRSGRDLSDRQ